MRRRGRHPRMLCAGATWLLLAIAATPLSAAAARGPEENGASPLPASDYSVEPVCGPVSKGARCLSSRLVPETAAARARSQPRGVTATASSVRAATSLCGEPPREEAPEAGLSPCQLHEAYVEQDRAEGTTPPTVAIVAAFDDPTALEDLKTYSKFYGLKQCTKKEHCFTKINQLGQASPLPPENSGWAEEISLDIETVHAICRDCHILLVEAESKESKDLEAAENEAAAEGANVISDSWVDPEPPAESAAFDHKGIVITAAAGDEGFLNWTGEAGQREIRCIPPPRPTSWPWVGHASRTYPANSGRRSGMGSFRETVNGGPVAAPAAKASSPPTGSVNCRIGVRSVADRAERLRTSPPTLIPIRCCDLRLDEGRGRTRLAEDGWHQPLDTVDRRDVRAGRREQRRGISRSDPLRKRGARPGIRARCAIRLQWSVRAAENGQWGPRPAASKKRGGSCSERPICVAGLGYDGPSGLGTPAQFALFEPTGAAEKEAQQLRFTSVAPTDRGSAGPALR